MAATVLAAAGAPRAPERALARNDNPSGYFGSGHEPAARAAQGAAAKPPLAG